MPNTLSAAASPRCSGALTSVRCLSGASSISIAVMKEANSPTVARCAMRIVHRDVHDHRERHRRQHVRDGRGERLGDVLAHVEAAQGLRPLRGSARTRSPARRTPSPPSGTRWSPAALHQVAQRALRLRATCGAAARRCRRTTSAISGPTASAISVSFQLRYRSHASRPTTAIVSFTTHREHGRRRAGDAGDVVGHLGEQRARGSGRRRSASESAPAARTSPRAGRAPPCWLPSACSTKR